MGRIHAKPRRVGKLLWGCSVETRVPIQNPDPLWNPLAEPVLANVGPDFSRIRANGGTEEPSPQDNAKPEIPGIVSSPKKDVHCKFMFRRPF